VEEVVLEHGFWGLVECGILNGWSACILLAADGVVGGGGSGGDGFGPICWDSDVIAAICSPLRWFVVKYPLLVGRFLLTVR
jgi:hypothetical protein